MSDVEKHIKESMKLLAKNIDEFDIGCKLFDLKYKKIRVVNNKTSNSIQVFFTRDSKAGIDCVNWFDMFNFNIRFRKATDEEIKEAEQKTKKTEIEFIGSIKKTKKTNDDFLIPKTMSFTTSETFLRK